jgi:hypothetical protein
VTATKSWGPTPTETVGTEVDSQVAAPLKREHPTCTERISLTQECGWKDGDRGGLAEWEQTHGKKKVKLCLDINRPSHGRSWALRDRNRWEVRVGFMKRNAPLEVIRRRIEDYVPGFGGSGFGLVLSPAHLLNGCAKQYASTTFLASPDRASGARSWQSDISSCIVEDDVSPTGVFVKLPSV